MHGVRLSAQRLQEAVKQSAEDVGGAEHAVLCHQPYKFCWIAELSKSENSRQNLHNMSPFVDLAPASLDLGAHKHMLCSALQSRMWYELLVEEV